MPEPDEGPTTNDPLHGERRPSYPHDPERHGAGTPGAAGRCSHHEQHPGDGTTCTGEAVVSFQDGRGHWQSGCTAALQALVDRGEIEPLGQGA